MGDKEKAMHFAPHDSNHSVSPSFSEAWMRCKNSGMDPDTEPAILTGWDFSVRDQRLLKAAKPFVTELQNYLAGIAPNMICIGNELGVMIAAAVNYSASQETDLFPWISVGRDFSEKSAGNNAIGTPIIENKTMKIGGMMHYCSFAHHLAALGAPIKDRSNDTVGSLAIFVPQENEEVPNANLITMAAFAIGSNYSDLYENEKMTVKLKEREFVIHSLQEGIAICTENMTIEFVNQAFASFFHKDPIEFININIQTFFSDHRLVDLLGNKNDILDYATELTGTSFIRSLVSITHASFDGKNRIIFRVCKNNRSIQTNRRMTFDNIIGGNRNFLDTINLAKLAAVSNSNILLLGESGSGKDILAQAIHNASAVKDGPFVPINCAAIPRDLIASELFGYVEGAFTGSRKGGSIGKFELANGGTIFLDEIGEMPLELQPMILRVLETKVVNKVGGTEYKPIDVRIISATNKNLLKEVVLHKFREDLYYRLNTISISVMPLRERKDDIRLLVEAFLRTHAQKHNIAIPALLDEIFDRFYEYHWPGNIRELQNTVERVITLSGGRAITPELLPDEMRDCNHDKKDVFREDSGSLSNHIIDELKTVMHKAEALLKDNQSSPETLQNNFVNYLNRNDLKSTRDSNERQLIKDTLKECRWNLSKASKKLGISRTTLYRKIDLYDLHQ